MTESEFETEVLTLSTKIASLVAQPAGSAAKSQLGPLAMTATGTPDLDSALAALTANPNNVAALENKFAAQVAGPSAPSTTSAVASPPVQPVSPGTSATALAPSQPPPAPAAAAPVMPTAVSPRGYMWVGPIISFAIIAGFFAMLIVLLWQQQHPAAAVAAAASAANGPASPTSSGSSGLQNVLFTLLGALGAAFTQVVNFWLGSSKGSSDKTDLLAATVAAQTQGQQ